MMKISGLYYYYTACHRIRPIISVFPGGGLRSLCKMKTNIRLNWEPERVGRREPERTVRFRSYAGFKDVGSVINSGSAMNGRNKLESWLVVSGQRDPCAKSLVTVCTRETIPPTRIRTETDSVGCVYGCEDDSWQGTAAVGGESSVWDTTGVGNDEAMREMITAEEPRLCFRVGLGSHQRLFC